MHTSGNITTNHMGEVIDRIVPPVKDDSWDIDTTDTRCPTHDIFESAEWIQAQKTHELEYNMMYHGGNVKLSDVLEVRTKLWEMGSHAFSGDLNALQAGTVWMQYINKHGYISIEDYKAKIGLEV